MAKKSLQGRYSPTIYYKRLRKEYCYLYNRKIFSQVRFSFQKKVVRGSMGRVDVSYFVNIIKYFLYSANRILAQDIVININDIAFKIFVFILDAYEINIKIISGI